jgi:K+-transporting ATPase ATPase C chain
VNRSQNAAQESVKRFLGLFEDLLSSFFAVRLYTRQRAVFMEPRQRAGSPWRTAVRAMIVFTLLTGGVFPLALFAISNLAFPENAKGGVIMKEGVPIGARLIGQHFANDAYFHPRPSAAGTGYDAAASGGTNLGPANPKLRDGDMSSGFAGVADLVKAYRQRNGLAPGVVVPIDAVTRSGSGLDPHISPQNAALQAPRVAKARQLEVEVIRRLIDEHTDGPQFGLFGEPRVWVLPLNLSLDRVSGASK